MTPLGFLKLLLSPLYTAFRLLLSSCPGLNLDRGFESPPLRQRASSKESTARRFSGARIILGGDEKGGGASLVFKASAPTAWRRAVENQEGDPPREPWPPLKHSALWARGFQGGQVRIPPSPPKGFFEELRGAPVFRRANHFGGDEKGGGASLVFKASAPTAWRRAVENPEGDPPREP